MGTLLQDIRYAIRMLAKNPGFTIIAVLTLALGIGANTAIFSVVNGVMLNPLPYPQPTRVVSMYRKVFGFDQASVPYLSFQDWQQQNRTIESMAAYREDNYNLTGMGEAERVPVGQVSADFFKVLGENPMMGRFFSTDEDRLGASPVIVLGEGFWKRKFGGSPDALGKTILLNGTDYTVIGIVARQLQNFQRRPSICADRAMERSHLSRSHDRHGHGCGGAAASGCDGGASASRHGFRGAAAGHRLSEIERGHGRLDDSASAGSGGQSETDPFDSAGGGGICAADCVRERGQSAAGARRRTRRGSWRCVRRSVRAEGG